VFAQWSTEAAESSPTAGRWSEVSQLNRQQEGG